jgi:hypothetical protein
MKAKSQNSESKKDIRCYTMADKHISIATKIQKYLGNC